MRDDELTKVPKSIEPWRVMEFLKELGITPKDVYEMTFGVRAVTVRLYATDEKGHRYLGEDGKKPAEHVVSAQYVGPWERPGPDAQVERAAIEVWRIECLAADPESADMIWTADWEGSLTDGEREEYRVKGRELLNRLAPADRPIPFPG